jgi:peptide deformylase
VVDAELAIVKYPDPVLRKRAERIHRVDQEVRKLAQGMLRVMYEEKGIGLAANQVACPRQLLVVNVGGEHPQEVVLVNPRLVGTEGEFDSVEGCLSLPGVEGHVPRYQKVRVRGSELSGKQVEIEADELLSRVLQHELDHLDGILIIDKMSPTACIACRDALRLLEQEYGAS